ncbi:MAG TPA: methyltransferase domain-containing protein [Phycisphaerae bacterium]|nr:methyltransferase domain-containing protein [Phycisphaerae bacterium]
MPFRTHFKSPCFFSILCTLFAVGCAAPEESVRPGVNQEYQETPLPTWVERFESESREIYRERERIARAAGIQEGMHVADVGAGTGIFVEIFAKAVGATGRVYAGDIKTEFVERIEKEARSRGLDNVTTVLGAERSANLPAGSIDLAFVCDTYHHFEYPRSMLASIRRALKPGGTLVIVDFERIPGKSRAWVLDHVRAGKEEVIKEIEAAGFDLVDQPATPFLTENYLLRFRKKGR